MTSWRRAAVVLAVGLALALLNAVPSLAGASATAVTPARISRFAAVAPEACPITPYWSGGRDDDFTSTWYRSGDLWAGLDQGFSGEWFAGAQGLKVQWRGWVSGHITVSGRRLDGPAPPMGFSIPSDYGGVMQPSSLVFPTAGCWEVTTHLANSTLRFVVRVVPEDEHPLYRAALAAHRALLPFPAPAACSVTPWAAPSRRGFDAFSFWVDGHGLSLGQQDGALFAGENTLRWLPDRGIEPALTFQRIDGPAPAPQVVTAEQITELGASFVSTVIFPTAGCWRLRAQAGPQLLDATLYVYPSACRPTGATGSRRSAACAAASVQ